MLQVCGSVVLEFLVKGVNYDKDDDDDYKWDIHHFNQDDIQSHLLLLL